MYYDGGKAYYSDGTKVPEYDSKDGSSITGLGGNSGGGLALIIGVFIGAVILGELVLLWYIFVGYKKFNLGIKSRIFAFGLVIYYGSVIYKVFLNSHPDLMLLVYANIPIALFFIIAYGYSKSGTKAKTATEKVASTLFKIIKVVFLYIIFPMFIIFSIFFYSLKISEPTLRSEFANAVNYSQIKERLTKDNFNKIFTNNISKEEKIIDKYNSLLIIKFASFLKNQKIIYIRNINDQFTVLRGSANSIEGFIALDKKIKDTNKNYPPLRLTTWVLLDIIDNLGSLDKGYSKKLALLIKENVGRNIIRSSYSEDIKNKLKRFNQISALKEYKRKEMWYK